MTSLSLGETAPQHQRLVTLASIGRGLPHAGRAAPAVHEDERVFPRVRRNLVLHVHLRCNKPWLEKMLRIDFVPNMSLKRAESMRLTFMVFSSSSVDLGSGCLDDF